MAAVQSNEVYPTPSASVRLVSFGGASDKRFPLGRANTALPAIAALDGTLSLMNIWLNFLATLVFFGCLFAAYMFVQRSKPKPRVLPPPRSKSTERSYQETNSVAKLFLETVSLKESHATWPAILKGLNAQDEPRVRTLLLELRTLAVTNPHDALKAIEAVCIDSKHESEMLTRPEILERAHSRIKRAQS